MPARAGKPSREGNFDGDEQSNGRRERGGEIGRGHLGDARPDMRGMQAAEYAGGDVPDWPSVVARPPGHRTGARRRARRRCCAASRARIAVLSATTGPRPVYLSQAAYTAAVEARATVKDDASLPDPVDASSSSATTVRRCEWCKGPVPARARRDAVCCSVRCRQARHRFTRDVGRARAVTDGRALRLAYADPPYPGMAYLYRHHPDYAGEVDHAALIRRLADEYDGWALSTSAAALPMVLAMCPPGVRVASWHRGPRLTASKWPLHAWEPVIYHGGRPVLGSVRTDSLVCGVSPLTTLPSRVIGAKPAEFCRWVFELLGAGAGDTLDDLFPGSGVVGRAWQAYAGPVAPGPGDASPTSGATGGPA